MNQSFRRIKAASLVLSILLCLAIPVVGLISTALFWQGSCTYAFTFTDGLLPCTWWESARYDMFLTSIFVGPFLLLTSLVWLGMTAVQFFTERRKQTG